MDFFLPDDSFVTQVSVKSWPCFSTLDCVDLIFCPISCRLSGRSVKKVDLNAGSMHGKVDLFFARWPFYCGGISKQVDLFAQHMQQRGPFFWQMMTVMLRRCQLKWTFFLNIEDCCVDLFLAWLTLRFARERSVKNQWWVLTNSNNLIACVISYSMSHTNVFTIQGCNNMSPLPVGTATMLFTELTIVYGTCFKKGPLFSRRKGPLRGIAPPVNSA